MSVNQSLFGSYIIPAKEWAGVKKNIFKAWNVKREALNNAGIPIYKAYKGRKYDLLDEEKDIEPHARDFISIYSDLGDFDLSVFKQLCSKSGKVCKPTQAMVEAVIPKAINKTTELCLDEWRVSLNNSTRTLSISVSENNHNVDRFWEMNDRFQACVFRVINDIKWSRNSGGEIKVQEESMNDEEGADKFVSSYLHALGPIGKKNEERRHDWSMRSFR